MIGKLSFVLVCTAVALAVEYPPGVNPAICPNYPFCDPEILTRFTLDGMPIPEWSRNPFLYVPNPAPAAAKYPADMPPALCPNYPYCW